MCLVGKIFVLIDTRKAPKRSSLSLSLSPKNTFEILRELLEDKSVKAATSRTHGLD